MSDESAASGAPAAGDEAGPPVAPQAQQPAPVALDKKKSIILGIIGLIFIVLIFWKVIPTIGSYSEALAALQNMGWASVFVIVVAVLIYLAVYGFPFMAAVPGLSYWHGQQINQAAFAISNGVPGGGAVGLAVQYGMLASYGVTPAASTSAIAVVGLWSIFVTLGFPIIGVGALVLAGANGGAYVTVALIGFAVLAAAIIVLALIVRSAKLARGLGVLCNKLVHPFGRWIKSLRDLDLVPAILNFRETIYTLVTKRWAWITLAQCGVFITQFFILYVALRGVEGWSNEGTPILIAFGAFAISQVGLMIPITPGGVGTVDAFMIAILTAFGVSDGAATAADLVWRAASFVPQILIGVIALITWYRQAGRKFAAAKPEPEAAAG
ncbi:MAG: lysylphosphatidylglycerol synthase transmembrane domain-containing protein [Candidatus Nanopelagicales bacterium]